jgi:small subunit ribosomal protein S5
MSNKYKNVELVKPSGLELKDRLVSVNRVTKVTRVVELSVSSIVVVGDENGVVGHGLGKSKDVSEAIKRQWKMLRKI